MYKRVGDVGERGFVSIVIEENRRRWLWGPLGPGDDASAVPYAGGFLILKIDGFASHDSKYPWNSWRDFGWKAVTACVSDIVSKGGRPFAYLVSIGLRPDMSLEEGLEVMRGVSEAVDSYGGYIAGGDTNSSREDVWIDVACLGHSSREPIRRGGRPGDLIVITGRFGLTGLGYYFYKRLVRGEVRVEDIPREVLEATSRPRARVEVYEVLDRYRDNISGSVDVSDSLTESLYLISEFSGYEVELERVPLDTAAERIASREGVDPVEQALYGGEEFEIVLSVEPTEAEGLVRDLRRLGVEADVYGRISMKRGLGVYLGGRHIERRGFQHF